MSEKSQSIKTACNLQYIGFFENIGLIFASVTFVFAFQMFYTLPNPCCSSKFTVKLTKLIEVERSNG